jgi:hypothetical protein
MSRKRESTVPWQALRLPRTPRVRSAPGHTALLPHTRESPTTGNASHTPNAADSFAGGEEAGARQPQTYTARRAM